VRDVPFSCPLPDELTAQGWRLRALTEDDWPLEVALSRDPEIVRWTLYQPDADEVQARERIARTRQWVEQRLGSRYAIVDAEGEAVGVAGIAMGTHTGEHPGVFYAVLPHGRRRGAATAAARALSDWALGLGHDRVLLFTIVGNAASERVAERAGFVPDGEETGEQRGRSVLMRRWRRSATQRTS
jgi:RimJ/RimL family protein N-acetyltransferase